MAKPKKKYAFKPRINETVRTRVFLDLITLLSTEDLKTVANEAEVTYQTLHNWLYGATLNPHINTLFKVANALGYEIALRKKSTTTLKRIK